MDILYYLCDNWHADNGSAVNLMRDYEKNCLVVYGKVQIALYFCSFFLFFVSFYLLCNLETYSIV